MELSGTTAIVTGAAVRIGRAIALALADDGVRLCLHYGRSADEAERTRAEVQSRGIAAITVQADLREPVAAAETIVSAAVAEFGRVDVLINNAAVFFPGTLASTDEAAWDRHLDVDLKAPFFLCRAFAEHATPANDRRGHIINLADWRALRPVPGHLAYTIAKSGLVTLTRLLAQELAPAVQVNAIAPGAILPPPDAPDDHLRRLAETIPLRRTGSPDEITEAVRFLLRSDFITGEVLHVTGGEPL